MATGSPVTVKLRSLKATAVAVLTLVIVPYASVLAQTVNTPQILILNTYDDSAAPYDVPTEIFIADIQREFGQSVVFHAENLDSRWGDSESREVPLSEVIKNRFADRQPDLVLAIGPPAISFWLRFRDVIAPESPLISVSRVGLFEPADFRPGDVSRWTQFSFTQAIEDIIAIRPETRHILMAMGSADSERALAAQAAAELKEHSARIEFEFTNDMTLEELRVRLASLSAESAVFYGVFNVDASGVILPRDSLLPILRSVSSAPVFGAFTNQVGNGIVGGRLIQLEAIGQQIGEAGIALLRGERGAEPWVVVDLSVPLYDWRELTAWGIDLRRLSADSEIRFQPPSVLDEYGGWISVSVMVILLQAILIGSLVRQRRERQRAEAAETRLGGLLISAHEEERRRIARELHDDLSQRLAGIAIDTGTIRADDEPAHIDESLRSLKKEVADISKDVHEISRRLHPSLVEDLGIVTALRTECQRVRQRGDIEIREDFGDLEEPIPVNTALTAYRIVQEALNNVLNHSQAETVTVALNRHEEELKLLVQDDGIGFDHKDADARQGIGIKSMRERVRLLKGHLHIESFPGAGTNVSATLPIQRARA